MKVKSIALAMAIAFSPVAAVSAAVDISTPVEFKANYRDQAAIVAKYDSLFTQARQKAAKGEIVSSVFGGDYVKVEYNGKEIRWPVSTGTKEGDKEGYWGGEFLAKGTPLFSLQFVRGDALGQIAYYHGMKTRGDVVAFLLLNAHKEGLEKLGSSREAMAKEYAALGIQSAILNALPEQSTADIIAVAAPDYAGIQASRLSGIIDANVSARDKLDYKLGRTDVATLLSNAGLTQQEIFDALYDGIPAEFQLSPADALAYFEATVNSYLSGNPDAFVTLVELVNDDIDGKVQTAMTTLRSELNTVKTQLEQADVALGVRIDGVAQAIAAETQARITAINTLQSALNTLETTLEAEDTRLAGLIAVNVAAIQANADAIADLQAEDTRLAGLISDNADDIADAIADISANTAAIAQNADAIADNVIDIAQNATDISNHSTLISTLRSDHDALANRVTAAESSITGNTAAITGLDTRLGTAEGTIVGLQGAVSTLQADVATLQTTVAGLSVDVAAANTAATNAANSATAAANSATTAATSATNAATSATQAANSATAAASSASNAATSAQEASDSASDAATSATSAANSATAAAQSATNAAASASAAAQSASDAASSAADALAAAELATNTDIDGDGTIGNGL